MTVKVKKSEADRASSQFAVDVAAYASELAAWKSHMSRVDEDAANGVDPADAHQAFPPPRSHVLIEACVNEDGQADFEIEDDGPTEDQMLEAAKRELASVIMTTEATLIEEILPSRRARKKQIEVDAVRARDAERSQSIGAELDEKNEAMASAFRDVLRKEAALEEARPNILKRTVAAITGSPSAAEKAAAADLADATKRHQSLASEIHGLVEATGSPAELYRGDSDQAIIDEWADTQKRIEQVRRWTAEQLDQIEDLTFDTIKKWSPSEPPTS